MPEIVVFCEDFGHEATIKALVARVAAELGLPSIDISIRNATGGVGRAMSALEDYLRDVDRGREPLPDVLVIGIDANCKGHSARRTEIVKRVGSVRSMVPERVAYAIPEPHVEQWLLLDSAAFKHVFGAGCTVPKAKCAKDEYKRLLSEAVRAAGVEAPLGGVEYADDLMRAADLQAVAQVDASLRALLEDLGRILRLVGGRAARDANASSPAPRSKPAAHGRRRAR